MLTLPIKQEWFRMILDGIKTEEYRDKTPYYDHRLGKYLNSKQTIEIKLRNGYRKDSPSINIICSVLIGTGNPLWGAEPGKQYYVIRIFEISSFSRGIAQRELEDIT